MKKSEFRALIREEIKKVLKEADTSGVELKLKKYFDSKVGGVTDVDASMMKGSGMSSASIEVTFNKNVKSLFNDDMVEELSDAMQGMGLKPVSDFEMISPMKVRLYL